MPITVVNIYANSTLSQMAQAVAASDGIEEEPAVTEPFSLVSSANMDTPSQRGFYSMQGRQGDR